MTYRQLFENAIDGIILAEPASRKLLSANPAACKMLGYTREEILKLEVADIHPEASLPQVIAQFEAQVRGELTLVRDVPLKHKDGWVFYVDVNAFPIFVRGELRLAGIFRDVTERRWSEMILRRSEEKFRSLAEQSPSMIFIYHEGALLYANTTCEKVLCYTRQELYAPDFDFASLIAPESKGLMQKRFKEHIQGKEVRPCELSLWTKDGQCIEVILSTRVIEYDDGVAILGILTDITARKKAERLSALQQKRLRKLTAKLAEAQDKEQKRIAEGLHDDVAQLLTAASVKLALIRGSGDPRRSSEWLEDIETLVSEANEKVHLLSFELSSSTLSKLGLRAAIEELCEGMGQRYGVRFAVLGNGQTDELDEASATVLFKSVRELLFNVVKHAGVTEATVFLAGEDNMLKLTVEDRGAGFSNYLSKMHYDTGKGLGLFGIRERLRDLGGKMQVDSEPDICTRVTLWAPLERSE